MSQARMMGAALEIDEDAASALERALLALARMWKAARDEADALESLMRRVLEERCPSLLAIYCLGIAGASEPAVAAGENPGRLRSEAASAMLCGMSPIPASSGKTSGRMRLNRGGDRRANKALHTVAVRRMRYDPRTRGYAERRMSGRHALSKPEAIRCVKRYIAREAYHALMHPRDVGERVDRQSLREARKGAGLSRAEAAHALGASPSTLGGFESGRCESRMLAERHSAWVLEGMPIDVESPETGS